MSAYSDAVLANSPYLYWRLGESSGTTASDSSGNSRNGTYTNTSQITYSASSLIAQDTGNTCVDLSGATSGGKIVRAISGDVTGTFSVEIWFKPDDTSFYTLASTKNGNTNHGWEISINSGTTFYITIPNSTFTGMYADEVTRTGTYSTSTPNHLVLTVNDSSDVAQLYVNGSQVGSNITWSGSVGFLRNTREISVGHYGGASTSFYFNGKVDEFALYQSDIGGSVAAHYNASVIVNATVNAVATDVEVRGQPATPGTGHDAAAVVTDTEVRGHDATVTAISNIEVTAVTTNITVVGQHVDAGAEGNPTILVDTISNIGVSGQPADASVFPDPVQATVTNVGIDGHNASIHTTSDVHITESSFEGDIKSWSYKIDSSPNAVFGVDSAYTYYSVSDSGAQSGFQDIGIVISGAAGDATITVYYRLGSTAPANGNGSSQIWFNGAFVNSASGGTIVTSSFVRTVGNGTHTISNSISAPGPWSAFFSSMVERVDIDYVVSSDNTSEDAEVEAEVTDIAVQGIVPAGGVGVTVTAATSNVAIAARQPIIATPGSVVVGANRTNTLINGVSPTLDVTSAAGGIVLAANTSVRGHPAAVRAIDDQFQFIPVDDNSLTAADAVTLVGFSEGAKLFGQEFGRAFKVGNVGVVPITLTILAMSVNTDIAEAVTFSTDKSTYSSTIVIDRLAPNAISDTIWYKMNAGDLPGGTGSFLITAEQTNA